MTEEHRATIRQRLHALAAFLPAFESPGFQFGSWHSPPAQEPGVIALPYYALGDVGSSLQTMVYKMGWILTDFDWPTWKETEEAVGLRDNLARLAKATPEQLARLLTVLVRQERYCEGSLAAAYDSGLLVHILRRASDLETEMIKEGKS